METRDFKYGQHELSYLLLTQDRKTISLTIYPNSKIVLKTPFSATPERINTFLKKKWLWIEKQIKYFKKHKREIETKEYISGESFYYLGRQYKLIVKHSNSDDVNLERGRIILNTINNPNNTKRNRQLLTNWFEQRAKIVLAERLSQVYKKFNYSIKPQLVIRKMPKRWGSYLAPSKIILNPALIRASKDCIDYVIAHELCHFKYKNHNKQFFAFQETITPNWKEIKEKLELKFL